MKQFKIEAQAVVIYELVVEANNAEEALEKATQTQDSTSENYGAKWEAIEEIDFAIDKNSVEEVV
jgi:hypothetical protein